MIKETKDPVVGLAFVKVDRSQLAVGINLAMIRNSWLCLILQSSPFISAASATVRF